MNHVNTDKFKDTIAKFRKDPQLRKKIIEVEGNWQLQTQLGPQFSAKLKTENAGEMIFQTDEPTFLGGNGTAGNPVQYCIAGLLACYASSFVKWATMENIVIKNFQIKGTANLDMGPALGIADVDALEHLKIEIKVDSDANPEKITQINEITKKRCPGYYCLTHVIIPSIDIQMK